MRIEGGVSLAFLVPNKPSSDNDDMAAGDVWSRVTCTQIVGSAGCVSFCQRNISGGLAPGQKQ